MNQINKHKSIILFFLMFFTLTSANRSILEEIEKKGKPRAQRYFIIPVKTNNEFHKEIGKQLKYSISTDSIIDKLPKQLQPKN